MTDKTKSQTYNFLIENKSIEDIKKQPNATFKEKNRHGGITYKLIEINNTNNQSVNDDLSENEIFYDAVDDLNNISTEEIFQFHTIQEKDQEIEQLKKQNEELKLKQSNVNLNKFKYNAVTIYNEKQRKKTSIEKIHEEILSIEDKIFFITTFVYINHSITENVFFFQEDSNCNIQVINQIKNYQNINEYTKDIYLIDQKNNNINKMTVKDFLKKQQDFKLKPTKGERTLWCIFTAIAVLAGISTFIGVIILFFPTVAVIPAVAIGLKVVSTLSSISFIRIFASLFSPATRKVDVWFGNKFYKNKEQKEKEKKERQSIIKNLSVDKLETKLQTQYEILKQELDNKKEKNPDKLISNNKINHNSNNVLENSNIESLNPSNFDSSIRNTVNQQEPQTPTSSNHNWNKVKCLLTT